MSSKHIKTGEIGERATLNHLIRKGFRHIESNFKAKTGEIDLILENEDRIHFVEVKTISREISNRSQESVSYGTYRPEDNVHRSKLRKIFNTIQVWLLLNKYKGEWQLDVAAVQIDQINKKASIHLVYNIISE